MKPLFYNLGQNCWENCILGQHFWKHHSCTGSSLSPFPWKQCCCVFKGKPDPWAFVGSNIELGEGFFFRKGVVLEIVLLRRKVYMMGKTFSSSFVRDCSISRLFFFSLFHFLKQMVSTLCIHLLFWDIIIQTCNKTCINRKFERLFLYWFI